LVSREWFSARPPGGPESNTNIQSFPEVLEMNPIQSKQIPGLNVKSFPTIPVKSVNSLLNNKSNHSKADADGITNYLKSMTMNELAEEQHLYPNQSYLLDQTID